MPDTPTPMQKVQMGTNDDGTPHYRYFFDGPEGGGVIRTGPVSGSVVLKDGTVYDLSEDMIAHHPGHGGPLAHHIGLLHEKTGRLDAGTHVCTEDCGDEALPDRMAEAQSPADGSAQA